MITTRLFQMVILFIGCAGCYFMVEGLVHFDWTLGFGLVLIMSTLLAWISIFPDSLPRN